MEKGLLADESLVELFKATKEDRYFLEIFSRFKQRIYLLSVKLLRNEALAEELTHDVFIKVFEKIDTYQGGNFYSWLIRVTQNAYIEKVRRFKREATALQHMNYHEQDKLVLLNGREYNFGEMSLLCQEVLQRVEELSPEQKVCFLLKYAEGYNYKEIAELTGYSAKQVKTYLQNGRRNFILCWQELEKRKKI